MNKVNNKKAINNLALSNIRSNIKKYMVLIGAVILTTLLFSSLFTVGGSMVNETQLATMRQIGTSCHAGLKYLCQSEYDAVKDDPELADISYRIMVGEAEGDAFSKLRVEVGYYEPEDAHFAFCYPEVGNMPEKENEIVLSDLTLDRMGVPHEVGSEFSMDIRIGDETATYDFVLSGYYRGDSIAMSQAALVSKEFQDKYAPTKQITVVENGGVDYVGWISADINFKNSRNIEDKVIALIERNGLRSNLEYGISFAYLENNIDPALAILCIILMITFFAAGYLIIYNIFDINIVSDMQEYGLLKTIGTTGKQLRKIVMRRATIVSAIGIPIGLILGVGVGAVILPTISESFSTVNVDKGALHLNVWIILGAAAFSYLTVLISASRPCRKAAKVSPIETLRYSEDSDKKSSKKKLVTVILSLSLSLVILNSVLVFVNGFSMDEFVKNMVISDFSIQDASLDNPGASFAETEGVDKAFLEELAKQDGINEIGNVYVLSGYQDFNDENWDELHETLFNQDAVRAKSTMMGSMAEENFNYDDYIESLGNHKSLDGKTYGMDEYAISKLNVVETIDGSSTIDWEKFNSGDYILVARWNDEETFVNPFEPGDKVRVRSFDPEYFEMKTEKGKDGTEIEYPTFEDAPAKEYEVYAVVDIPLALGFRHFGEFDMNYILPTDEFLSLNGEHDVMRTLVDVEDGKEEALRTWLKDYTKSVNPDLDYKSKDDIKDEYKQYLNMIELVGAVLSIILGMIGILNFANTIVISILVRSRELAMLEAVGMTGKQQKVKLMKEGLNYFIWTAIVSAGVASILNLTAIKGIMSGFSMLTWSFSLTPLIACLPVLCLLVIIIPVIAYSRLSKRSVVDRLRIE